jgi:hypothetical protein
MLAFGGLFVPSAFEHLPTQLAAGVLRDGFEALDGAGMALAAACTALGVSAARGERSFSARARALLPLVGIAAHALSLLWVSPRLHALRVAAGGAIGQAGSGGLAEFSELHALSRALFGGVVIFAAAALVWDLTALRAGSLPRS